MTVKNTSEKMDLLELSFSEVTQSDWFESLSLESIRLKQLREEIGRALRDKLQEDHTPDSFK